MTTQQRKIAKALGKYLTIHATVSVKSIRGVARTANLSPSYVCKVFSGDVLPCRATAIRLCLALKIPEGQIERRFPVCPHCNTSQEMKLEHFE